MWGRERSEVASTVVQDGVVDRVHEGKRAEQSFSFREIGRAHV